MDKTIAKAVTLIECLAASEDLRGISDLARELNWSKSNVHRVLTTLEAFGYIRRDAKTGQYTLGLKFWEIGTLVVARSNLKTIARPYAEQLCKQTGETVHLVVFDNDHVVYMDQVESMHPIRAHSRIGGIGPLHSTATGKAILAFSPPDVTTRISSQLRRFTPNTVVSQRELMRELELTRANGFATAREEWQIGVSGVAAPIFGSDGGAVGAIGISGPASRLNDRMRRQVAPAIIQAARRISKELGFQETLSGHDGTSPAKRKLPAEAAR